VPAYLVERYWPGVTSDVLFEAMQRLRQVMHQMISEGTQLRDVSCTLVPSEEVVFSVYESPTADMVRVLNERAAVPVSRIVEVMALIGELGPEDRRQGGHLSHDRS
jgi:hypothetical protein